MPTKSPFYDSREADYPHSVTFSQESGRDDEGFLKTLAVFSNVYGLLDIWTTRVLKLKTIEIAQTLRSTNQTFQLLALALKDG